MSQNENSKPEISPEREFAYLQNAEKVANEAAEPVIKGLADLAIAKTELVANEPDDALLYANSITKDSANMSEGASKVGDEAEEFAHANDYTIDEGVNTGIAEGASDFLYKHNVAERFKDEEIAAAVADINTQSNEEAYKTIGKGLVKASYGIPINFLLTKNEKALLEDNSPRLDSPR